MFKKLLLFSVMFLLLISISVEPVEAGWFEDAVNWIMELFGFSQEEAEAYIKNIKYTINSWY